MPNNSPDQHSRIDQEKDPLWDLLGKASTTEPSRAFAQNVLRATRQLPAKLSLAERLTEFFSIKAVAISAVTACACVLAVSQLSKKQDTSYLISNTATNQPAQTQTVEISELIIQETLLAAATDPSIFTHDEVLAMVGF